VKTPFINVIVLHLEWVHLLNLISAPLLSSVK